MAQKPTYKELENRVNELMVQRSHFAKVEAELNRSIRFTKSLLSAIPTPIFFKDAQGRYQGCNPAFTEIMGVAAQDLHGKTVQELWPSEHAEIYHQKDLELMLHPERQIYEFQIKDKNGIIRPVIFYKNVFYDEHDHVAGLVGGFVDITERKRIEDSLNKSERKYHQLFEKSTDAIFIVNKSTGRYLDANAATEVLTGFPVSELKNLTTHEVTPYGAKERLKTLESSSGKTNFEEVIYIRKDGSKRIAKLSVVPLDDETVYSIAHDITESKKAEKRLRDSELKFRNIVNSSPMGIHLYELREDDHLVFIGANPASDRILGIDTTQFVGKTIEEAFHGLIDTEVPVRYRDAAKTGSIWRTEQIIYREGMINGVFEVVAFQIEPGKMAAFFNEITSRKKAKEALQESEQKYKSLANNLNVGIFRNTAGPEGRFIEANPAIVKMFGFDSREEFLNTRVTDLYKNSNDREKYSDKLFKVGSVKNEELQLQKKDGTSFIGSVSAVVVKNKNNEVKYYDGIIEDITERRQTEMAIRQSEEKYRTVLEANPDPVVVYDIEGNVVYFNPAFTTVFGWTLEERFGEKNDNFVPEEAWFETKMMIDKVLSGERFSGIETIRYNKEGEIIPVSISGAIYKDQDGNPVGSIINLRDISDQKKMEAKLQQSQKMEAIGTLAGGIAHDFNNMLFPLVGYSEMLREDLPSDSPLQHNVNRILEAAMRSKDLVNQILAFSRQGHQEIKLMKLQPIVKECIKLLRSSIPTTIDIQQDIDPDCDAVVADSTQVHQIVMNLATNSYHAMEESGGSLEVLLKQVRVEPSQSFLPDLTPGEYARLTVADTGIGIEKDALNKIFDPYFTTKIIGKGTGLGLSVVQGIVKRCHGDIRIHTEPGEGTEIQVYLPIVDRKVQDIPTDRNETIEGGTEKILLVDDELTIARMQQLMLERLGYQVFTRTGSVDALEAFKANVDTFDLVITDMNMPNMNGVQLAKEIKKIRPEIPIILCTGFSYQVNDEKSKALGIQGFLMKPVVKKEIARIIRKVLDKS